MAGEFNEIYASQCKKISRKEAMELAKKGTIDYYYMNDKELVLIALKQNGKAIQQTTHDLQNDQEVIKASKIGLVRNDLENLSQIDTSYFSDEKFVDEICLAVKDYVKKKAPNKSTAEGYLKLADKTISEKIFFAKNDDENLIENYVNNFKFTKDKKDDNGRDYK